MEISFKTHPIIEKSHSFNDAWVSSLIGWHSKYSSLQIIASKRANAFTLSYYIAPFSGPIIDGLGVGLGVALERHLLTFVCPHQLVLYPDHWWNCNTIQSWSEINLPNHLAWSGVVSECVCGERRRLNLQCTMSIIRLLTDGGTPLEAIQR